MNDLLYLIELHRKARERVESNEGYDGLDSKAYDAEHSARCTEDFNTMMALWSYPTTSATDLREKAEYLASLPDGWLDSFTMDHDRMRTFFASLCSVREAA